MSPGLLPAVRQLVDRHWAPLSKPLRSNLALLTVALLAVLAAARSGAGQLSLAAVARALPTGGRPHSRETRLARLLANPRLESRTMTTALGGLLLPTRPGACPLLLDQTKAGSTQALVAAVPYAGRALPLALYTFAYPLTEPALTSQNHLEHVFLLDVETALPPGLKPIWIADRGYARALLLAQSEEEGRWYLIRGRGNTLITYQGRRMKLKALPVVPQHAHRYEQVRYQAHRQVLVDVVVYWEPRFDEPWYLLVPVPLRAVWSAEQVVDWYRERMQIEHSFRDFKTHLGLRGLKLQTDVAARMGRLLLAFCLAYILAVLLGDSPLGTQARAVFEIPRGRPRHGTTRTLSAVSLAMLMLSHPQWVRRSLRYLLGLIHHALHDTPWLSPSILIALPRPP